MKPTSHRMATWWMHWEDLNWPDPDNMDKIKRRAEGFAMANVSAAMIFGTHFRWDYIPYLPLLHDYLATVAEELHSYGITRSHITPLLDLKGIGRLIEW